MRAAVLGLASLLALVALAPPAGAQDFGEVGKVNRLISVFETPQLAPGESGPFRFELNVTYAEPIANVTLTAEIYRYATIDESIPVDAAWPYAYPRIRGAGVRNVSWSWASIPADNATPLEFVVETAADSRDMPHGSVFSQATYLVRFALAFEGIVAGVPTAFEMKSLGHFTQAQWEAARNETNTDPCVAPWCRGNVNLTVLGVDGLLPDSSFGVKEPIPQWPFYGLVVGAVFFLGLAFLFWVEENPGTYPRIEAWWARTRGRLVRVRRSVFARRPPAT